MTFSALQAEDRRRQVAALLRQGYREIQIARQLGVAPSTVSKDATRLRAEWRQLRDRDRDAWIETELAKLDAAEAEAWRFVAEGGRPRLFGLDRVLAVMDRRARLLGLDAPTKIDIAQSVKDRAEAVAREHDLDVAEVMAEMEAVLAGRVDSSTA